MVNNLITSIWVNLGKMKEKSRTMVTLMTRSPVILPLVAILRLRALLSELELDALLNYLYFPLRESNIDLK